MPIMNPGVMTWQELLAYKQGQMKHYRDMFNLETFIETGTNSGDSVEFARHIFPAVYSVELHPGRYELCSKRFAGMDNVHLFQGDSEVLLSTLLKKIPNKRILFWLDAHAGGEEPELVGVGKHNFSGLFELAEILRNPPTNSVIMVDDMYEVKPPHVCNHKECGCLDELKRIAPDAVVEMSIARVVLP